MKSVILANQLRSVQRALQGNTHPLVFVELTVTQESLRISKYLRSQPNTTEVSAREVFRDRREIFGKKYIGFIDRLNLSNQSLEWWGIPITDKMPSGPDLCRDVAGFLLVVDLVRLYDETVVVISDNVELGAQVGIWAKQEGLEAIVRVQRPRTWKSILKYHTPAGIIAAFFKTIQSRWLPSRRFWPPPNTQEEYVVVQSHTHVSSFRDAGAYRDAYFGPLVDHLASSGKRALVLAGVQEQPQTQLKKLKDVTIGLPVIPVESCLTFMTLVSILFRSLTWYARKPKMKGTTTIDGLDVSYLVNNVIHETRHSGNMFMNLLVFHASKRLASTLSISRWLYPFENLAWEKMMLLGAESSSPDTQMIGYQHASITKSNAIYQSMVLPEEQAQVMPFPDLIVTTGDVTHRWLEKEGHYPPETSVRAACALRPAFAPSSEPRAREPRLTKILVALATNHEEYVRILVFLEQAFSGTSDFEVRVRPHPVIPIEPALKAASLPSEELFTLSSGTLQEDLGWASVVLYASSTVGLEAISLGLPAINLDLGNFLDEDPMLGWSEFKWPVTEPPGLIDAIKQIESLAEPEFLRLQQAGQEYAAAYLKPVTEEGLARFLED